MTDGMRFFFAVAQWSMNKEFLALTPDEIVKIRAEMEQHLSSTLRHDEIEVFNF